MIIIRQRHLPLPIILGINNSQEMNEKIMSGEIYGTVDNNMDDQVYRIIRCMKSGLMVIQRNIRRYGIVNHFQ